MKNKFSKETLWTSDLNDMDVVQQGFDRTQSVRFYDTTLRDGEQSVGIVFSADDKFKIACKLAELGVGRIESGFPRVSEEDTRAVRRILDAGLSSEIWGFSRAVQADVDAHLDLGTEFLLIEITTSDRKMKAFGFTREKVMQKVTDTVKYAKDKGIKRVNFFAVDSTRSDLSYLKDIYSAAIENGADEVSVVDTIGVLAPEAVAYIIGDVKERVGADVPVHWHGHNDFGMATAAAVAAVRAGASWIQGTINGMGERAGNADICEVALALEGLYKVPVELDLTKAREISRLVQTAGRYTVEGWKPVVGEFLYTRESGGVVSQFHVPEAIEPYSADIVAAERKIVLGKKSGLASIDMKSKELGLDIPEDKRGVVLQEVKDVGTRNGRLVTDDEFKGIVNQLCA
jgi:isopropylmalate/homocitrate/citramalate synthase